MTISQQSQVGLFPKVETYQLGNCELTGNLEASH